MSSFLQILALQPHNGFAQCHLGFILKTLDNNHEEAVKLLQAGIDSREQGTQDGRFFFHLGDAYNRLGRSEEVGFGFIVIRHTGVLRLTVCSV